MLWPPRGGAPAAAAPFLSARRALAALRPEYLRVLVDWAALQPAAGRPADLAERVGGCARGLPPCGTYEGVVAQLAAVAAQQRAARAEGRPAPQLVLDILGVPAWAADTAHGCESAGTTDFARALRPVAIADYRALVGDLAAAARAAGAPVAWWSPWNEPNDPRFLAPQRASCAAGGRPLAPAVYAELARALARELSDRHAGGRILLGELGGYGSGSEHRLAAAEFVAALPPDVACLGGAWSVHAYATWGAHARESDPVAALERALDARGGCAAGAPVWVTEAGAGAPEPGRPRLSAPAEEREGCLALARQLEAWRADPRVAVVLQYELRDDPAFPVGLMDAGLSRTFRTYGVWLQRGRQPAAGCGG